MAKAIAKCTCERCGNAFEMIAFKRNRKEADNYEEWASKNCTVCPDCYKAEMAAERAKKDAQYAPITEGSEKQIAWAVKIRLQALDTMADLGSIYYNGDPLWPEFVKFVANSHSDARFWIDNRDAFDCNTSFRPHRDFWDAMIAAFKESRKSQA